MSEDRQLSELSKFNKNKWPLGNDGSLKQNKLIKRYTAHKRRSEEFVTYLKNHFYEVGHEASLKEINLRKQIPRVDECGSYLLFRQYYLMQDDTRLVSANFCKKHTLCGLCAVRRAAKGAQNLHEKAKQVLSDQPNLKAHYIVLTVKNEPDLEYGMRKLKKAWKRVRDIRNYATQAKKRVNPSQSKYASALGSQFANVVGGAYSIEVTYNEEEKTWHPHINLLVLSETEINNNELSSEWHGYTGDSFITHCKQIDLIEDRWAFCEIMKYAMKFSELGFKQHKEAYLTLLNQRLKGSIGAFRGTDLNPDPADETLEGEPYIETLLSYLNGNYNEFSERRSGVEQGNKEPVWVRSDLLPNK
jgi:hypothetical protein